MTTLLVKFPESVLVIVLSCAPIFTQNTGGQEENGTTPGKCSPGSFVSLDLSSCVPCPANTYSTRDDALTCTACPTHSRTQTGGADRLALCKAPCEFRNPCESAEECVSRFEDGDVYCVSGEAKSSTPVLAITLGVAGGVLLVLAVLVIVCIVFRNNKPKQKKETVYDELDSTAASSKHSYMTSPPSSVQEASSNQNVKGDSSKVVKIIIAENKTIIENGQVREDIVEPPKKQPEVTPILKNKVFQNNNYVTVVTANQNNPTQNGRSFEKVELNSIPETTPQSPQEQNTVQNGSVAMPTMTNPLATSASNNKTAKKPFDKVKGKDTLSAKHKKGKKSKTEEKPVGTGFDVPNMRMTFTPVGTEAYRQDMGEAREVKGKKSKSDKRVQFNTKRNLIHRLYGTVQSSHSSHTYMDIDDTKI